MTTTHTPSPTLTAQDGDSHVSAPRRVYACAAYVVEPHDGDATDYAHPGDPVIVDTLGWYYWHDGLPENYGEHRALSEYVGYVGEWGYGEHDDGHRLGAILAAVTIPEAVRRQYADRLASGGGEAFAAEAVADFVDTVEWDANWMHENVHVIRETPAFRENRERVTARALELAARTAEAVTL